MRYRKQNVLFCSCVRHKPLYTLREKEKEHKPVYESMHTFWTIIYLSARLLFMSLCERKERNKASEKGGMTFWNE